MCSRKWITLGETLEIVDLSPRKGIHPHFYVNGTDLHRYGGFQLLITAFGTRIKALFIVSQSLFLVVQFFFFLAQFPVNIDKLVRNVFGVFKGNLRHSLGLLEHFDGSVEFSEFFQTRGKTQVRSDQQLTQLLLIEL